jgi:hypothetical protein
MYFFAYSASIVQVIDESCSEQIDLDDYQFLTRFEIKVFQFNNKLRLTFENNHNNKQKKNYKERVNTDESNSAYEDNE